MRAIREHARFREPRPADLQTDRHAPFVNPHGTLIVGNAWTSNGSVLRIKLISFGASLAPLRSRRGWSASSVTSTSTFLKSSPLVLRAITIRRRDST
jgi:hypothetical protein